MAQDNHFVQEDVLFAKKPEQPVEEVPTSVVENFTNADLGEEVLFASSSDNVGGFIEEFTFDDDVWVEDVIVENEDVGEESLFINQRPSAVVEDVAVEDEPVVTEEVEPVVEVDNTETVVSDELNALAVEETVANVKPVYIEKNFAQKFIESDEEILKRYDELKNIILKYKGVKSRVSNDFDSFNMGRTQLFKLGFSTQSLKLYLNLDYNQVESRLKCKDVSHKKAYAQVPVFLRIKSPRAMRNAKYLINQVAEKFNLKENPKATYVDSIKILKERAKTYNKD